ncbi:MAG: hypothetical protein JXR10_07110 [Cyclobacteriaceae bacterium]
MKRFIDNRIERILMGAYNVKGIIKMIPVMAILLLLVACKDDMKEVEKEEIIDESEEGAINPTQVVEINTNTVVGPLYNFWSTRPMINQTRFASSSFVESLEVIKPYVKSYNLVRVLGGRNDNMNTMYLGVDADGKIKVNFSGLISDLRAFMRTGFKPRLVLDNVPWEMSLPKVSDTYGNSKPPTDYDIWRQYINAFLQELIDEFGMEEVKTWRFRVATEPNYTPAHWRGTMEEYFKHYDITVDEVLKVIPDAIIGPGNMLTEGLATYTTELIDHCANGTNYATGGSGTRMSFFAVSYYEKIDENTVSFVERLGEYRTGLDQYSQFSDIPFDIQEFGILRDENRVRGISLVDATEFGASWYAAIADLAYEYRVTEIYDWGQEIESSDLPQGRRHVTTMLLKMEDGSRLATSDQLKGHAGVIPVSKDGKLYLLAYNHSTTRNKIGGTTIFPKLEGDDISASTSWKMNEWTVDKQHGVMMHELYKDLRNAGISENGSGRIYGNRPSDRFGDGWVDVLNANLAKYESLAELPQTVTDSTVTKAENGSLTLKVDLEPHAVKLIELIPN